MLTDTVTDSLSEASGHVRNALAFAARNERPVTINAISRILHDIESLQSFDGLLDKIDEHETIEE